jgi:hypothetical protein
VDVPCGRELLLHLHLKVRELGHDLLCEGFDDVSSTSDARHAVCRADVTFAVAVTVAVTVTVCISDATVCMDSRRGRHLSSIRVVVHARVAVDTHNGRVKRRSFTSRSRG